MKLFLFGTGDYYSKYKKWFKDEDIALLVDNNQNKCGSFLDGHLILSPEQALKRAFDYIIILSVYEKEIQSQLAELGVNRAKIIRFSDLYKYPGVCVREYCPTLCGSNLSFEEFIEKTSKDTILLMSPNLDLNGATLALFYAAKIMKQSGYKVVFASWNDGELNKYLTQEGIPIIIDCNLEMKTASEIYWSSHFEKIVCNTIYFYRFLSDRRLDVKILWWLHDPIMFYELLNIDVLLRVSNQNLMVCAVGPISEFAFKKYRSDIPVYQLIYGIPDCDYLKKEITSKLELVTIGSIQEYKGQDIVIKAIINLNENEKRQIHLSIIGAQKSCFADNLKNMARELGEIIKFIQPVSREEINQYLDGSDILICPSRIDTMSISSNEAMQHGIPCIVSDATGVASYIHDGIDGLVFQNENVQMLTSKIRWCIYNKDKIECMGKNSRKIYEKCFSMEVFERNLLEIINHFFFDTDK